jgi:hypothetical protein
MRNLRAALAAAVFIVPAVVIAGPALSQTALADTTQAAVAAEGHPLPIAEVGDEIVDPVHRHVLVSDPYGGKLVATNYLGEVVAVHDDPDGVGGLTLSADSKTLYATLTDAHAIAAFDTVTLTETARYPLSDDIYPEHLTRAGGKLWFGYRGDYEHSGYLGNFGSLDLSGAEPVVHLHDATTDGSAFSMSPYVSTAVDTPGVLLVADSSSNFPTSGTASTYDVSSGAEVALSHGRVSPVDTVAATLTADGTEIIASTGCDVWQTSVTDMTQQSPAYAQDCGAQSMAAGADGRIALGYDDTGSASQIRVYPAGSQTATETDDLWTNALAFEPGGPRLFAIGYDGSYKMWTFDAPALIPATIKVSAPASAPRAKALTVTGTVTTATPLPAGERVTVTRTDLDSPSGKSLAAVAIDAKGHFSFKDTPPDGGTVTYTVSYTGDDTYAAVVGRATVAVSRVVPTLTLSGNGSINAYGSTRTFTAHLGATYKSRTVEIWADPYGTDQGSRLLKRAVVNSKGDVAVGFKLTRTTAVTAEFLGDSRSAPKTVTAKANTKVKVSLLVGGFYKSPVKIGGTKYYEFKRKTQPWLTTTMTAYPKRKGRLTVDYYSGGKWHSFTSGYVALGSTGKSHAWVTGSQPLGTHFRVRAAYVTGSSGDNVNYTTYSSYSYFIFIK